MRRGGKGKEGGKKGQAKGEKTRIARPVLLLATACSLLLLYGLCFDSDKITGVSNYTAAYYCFTLLLLRLLLPVPFETIPTLRTKLATSMYILHRSMSLSVSAACSLFIIV